MMETTGSPFFSVVQVDLDRGRPRLGGYGATSLPL